MTRIVTGLEKDGLVRREDHPNDRRSFRVSLAPHRSVVPVGIVTVQPDVPLPFQLTSRVSG